jgi:hypothetical protein
MYLLLIGRWSRPCTARFKMVAESSEKEISRGASRALLPLFLAHLLFDVSCAVSANVFCQALILDTFLRWSRPHHLMR